MRLKEDLIFGVGFSLPPLDIRPGKNQSDVVFTEELIDVVKFLTGMKNITTIFFDIDGTLIDHKGAQNKAIEQIRKKYMSNFSNEKFQTNWLKFTKKNWFLFEQGKINFLEQKIARVKDTWNSFDRSIDNKYAEKIISEYVSNYELNLTSFPHVLPTLQYLYKKNIVWE